MENITASNASSALLKSAWEQARDSCPQIKSGVQVSRHFFRGQLWYVLQRAGSERLHRINGSAWHILGRCDGKTRLSAILAALKAESLQAPANDQPAEGGDAHVWDEVELLRIINQFSYEGIITIAGFENTRAHVRPAAAKKGKIKLSNPLAIHIPLWNPNRFLFNNMHFVRPLFTRTALIIWLFVIMFGAVSAATHWAEISQNVLDRAFQPGNLFWLWLLYPLTKIFHELGHAFATRIHGGAVNETGIMVMYGVPVPYVDASAAAGFPLKRHRLLVDAIGIMVELAIAVLALAVWLSVEPGLLSQLAYNTMFLCSLSTLLFNANPLMRFDGYYLLADYLEIPNLGNRAYIYWRYLFKRYIFGVQLSQAEINALASDRKERLWLTAYGAGSFIYRIGVLTGIIWLAAQYNPLLGVAVLMFIIYGQVLMPLQKLARYLLGDALGEHKRRRLTSLSLALIAVLLILIFVPFPLKRTLSAVVWTPGDAEVRTQAQGFIQKEWVRDGEFVHAGQILFSLEDPTQQANMAAAKADLSEAQTRYQAALPQENKADAVQFIEDITALEAQVNYLQQQIAQLTVTSQSNGIFYFPPAALPALQRFVKQGEVIGYVVAADLQEKRVIRAMVSQDDIGLLQQADNHGINKSVKIWIANWPAQIFNAEISRVIPAASQQLPSPVLGSRYGGEIAIDPADASGQRALTEWFQLEITLNSPLPATLLGTRAWASVVLGSSPLALQAYRHLRQLFLKRLNF
jgi:putative peptide zinc metalloprotease protein